MTCHCLLEHAFYRTTLLYFYFTFLFILLSFYLPLHCITKLPFITLQTPTFHVALLATTTQTNSSAKVVSPRKHFKHMYVHCHFCSINRQIFCIDVSYIPLLPEGSYFSIIYAVRMIGKLKKLLNLGSKCSFLV